MKLRYLSLVGCTLLLFACSSSGGAATAPGPRVAATPTTTQAPAKAVPPDAATTFRLELGEALKRSGGYLAKATQDNGHFDYRINLNPAVKARRGYNVLRHAGAIYALTQLETRFPDPTQRTAMMRATNHLRELFIAPVPSEEARMLAVWSAPKGKKRKEAKLGGAGLALLALTRVERLSPGETHPAELEALAAFIAYMQKPDGSFYSKFFSDERGRSDKWTSLYYPGEAAFGLAEHVAAGGKPKWREHSRRALLYLARKRRGEKRVAPDHWALLATESLLKNPDDDSDAESRALLLEHAAQIAGSILDTSVDHPAGSELFGSLTKDDRTTPTATRLEGLAAAQRLFPDDHRLQPRLRKAMEAGSRFLMRAQRTSGEHAGAIAANASPNDDKASTEVRIDYVQHAVSAWVGYFDFTAAKP